MDNGVYTKQQFYCFLKLGIWSKGSVEGWGMIERLTVSSNGLTDKGCIVTKIAKDYGRKLQIHDCPLSIGLQLLDIYPLEIQQTNKYNNRYKIYTYVAVVSECRLRGTYEEKLYYLKITNNESFENFKDSIYDNLQYADTRKRKSFILRKNRRVSRFNSVPLNSIKRKH